MQWYEFFSTLAALRSDWDGKQALSGQAKSKWIPADKKSDESRGSKTNKKLILQVL
jgi:hypothetical protein